MKRNVIQYLMSAFLMAGSLAYADFVDDARYNRMDKVKKALAENPNIVKEYNQKGISVLEGPALKDNDVMINLLLEHGADVNLKNKYGRTALTYAANKGKAKAVKALLDAGADINIKDENDLTALHYAAIYGDPSIVQTLLDVKDKNGKPVADLAISSGFGDAPLHKALSFSGNATQEQTGLLLIEAGAPLKVFNQTGEAPLHLAAKQNYVKAIELMLKKGVPVDVPLTKKGESDATRTPLMFAVMAGSTNAVKVLLENGAKVTKEIMDAAEERDNNDVIDLLDKHKK